MKAKLLLVALALSLFGCEKEECKNCGVPSDKIFIKITFDDEIYELKAGYYYNDNGVNSVLQSSDIISYGIDYNSFTINLSDWENESNLIFPNLNIILPSGEITTGLQNNINLNYLLLTANNYTYTNELPYWDYDRQILINNYSLNISKFIHNPYTDPDQIEGYFTSSFTSIDDGQNHTLRIDFEIDSDVIDDLPVDTNTIVGTWVNLNGCSNVNNQKTYFQFNSDGTGKIYNVDCNSTCTGYGYYLYFNYTDNGDSFTLNYTSVSEYCGYTAPTPSAETINYTKSENQLTFGGANWTKQ